MQKGIILYLLSTYIRYNKYLTPCYQLSIEQNATVKKTIANDNTYENIRFLIKNTK